MQVSKSRWLLWAAALLLLAGCEGLLPTNSDSSGAAPIIQGLIQGTPANAVEAFLNAWGSRNYDAMYNQLSAESQRLIALPVFRATYEQADGQIGTTGVTYNILNTRQQGVTAAVTYDINIQSSTFGVIVDEGRTMRTVRAPDGTWRVAWTTMDIFDGFASGARLEAGATRPPRGNIYDRSGQLMVEQDGEVITLYVARQSIVDFENCMTLLAMLLRRERAELIDLADDFNPETVFPVGDIDRMEFEPNEPSLTEYCNIITDTRITRRYVGHGIASHVIGYIGGIPAEQVQTYLQRGYAEGDLVGLAGVEQVYEEQLAGSAARTLRIIEPSGLTVRELGGAEGVPPQSVTLTLDVNLQRAAAQALSDAYNMAEPNWANRAHSTGGGVVVMDVNTGAVLALASYPSFDPGIFSPDTPIFQVGSYIARLSADARRPFINRVTQTQYAPGSVFKIVTTAATGDQNLFEPDQTFYCGMEWRGQDYGDTSPVRLDWRATEVLEEQRFATGTILFSQALTASCNPFFYQMGAELYNRRGQSTLTDYARRMGLGQLTGIDVVPEVAGQIIPARSVEEAINIAIGQQETQVTIIQMARLTAGIANGGTLYRPYLVQQVGGDNGTEPSFVATPQAVGQMNLSDEAMAVVRQGMCDVTQHEIVGLDTGKPLGTAWGIFDDPEGRPTTYMVCGKTGTAQTGRIEPFGWFVAYAPADNPQIAVAAMIEHGREGSETAAPIVRRVMDAYFGQPPVDYPGWWQESYVPMNIPSGSTGG